MIFVSSVSSVFYGSHAMGDPGRVLMIAGGVLLLLGALFSLGGRLPWLGRLPGDIVVERENFRFYFPLATSIVISIILSLLFALFRR
jgi:membrane protein implicated in regulation of membrane protease activity